MSEHSAPHFIDVDFLDHPGVIGTGVLRADGGAWLVDPGPATGLPGLERGLGKMGLSLADIRGLLLTHIHLDHAGATGVIVRQHPAGAVFVHERGAPHVIDPSRLLESAGRLYAGHLEDLWGEVPPVPAANVRVLKGGERLDLGGRPVEVAYTPGHASHHVSYFDVASGSAFVGDTGGVRLQGSASIIPPTPPPDIDVAAWHASIARVREWKPSRVYVTHFGGFDQADSHLATLDRQIDTYAELARQVFEEPGTDEERMARFVDRAAARLKAQMPEEEVSRYRLAMPLEHCWLGLSRYWKKHATAPRATD